MRKKKQKYTNISEHRRSGKVLTPPLATLPNIVLRSWYDECIPNIIWACVLASNLDRSVYLKLLREVVIDARERLNKDEYENAFLTHNYLSLLSDQQFDQIFYRLLKNDPAKHLLSSLLLIDALPDGAHWRRHLQQPSPQEHFSILARAIAVCFDHQSQASTDIRWMKIMYLIVCGKMHFGSNFAERLEELRLYPDKGDMRSVLPFIRATEMVVRTLEFGEEASFEDASKGIGSAPKQPLPQKHGELFWQELYNKTECMPVSKFTPPIEPNTECKEALLAAYEQVGVHFHETIKNTSIDPKHDAVFGLILYALSLGLNLTIGYSHTLAEGRIFLRSIMEAFVILHYLRHVDNPSIWKKYRTDGIGKTKLAFLKNINSEELPAFFDVEQIERLASEDMWLEMQDINVGSWSNSDLRTMATEAGVKDVYDKYYDWASGFSHSQWICVRDTVFTICANPLHRYHRIPVLPNSNMPSVIPDVFKLINGMLVDLDALYPQFKARLSVIEKPIKQKTKQTDAAE